MKYNFHREKELSMEEKGVVMIDLQGAMIAFSLFTWIQQKEEDNPPPQKAVRMLTA